MSMRINTNIEALNAQRNLGVTASAYARSVERLSSGLRINRAADDAAGLAISEKLQAQVQGLNQAQRNAQDGVSMVQTAEGALTEVHSMLHRIRELAVEAANSTVGTADAASINAEITSLQAEITRISSTITFNGQHLLTGALSVSQSGGTVGTGYLVAAGSSTWVVDVAVSGAKAATTYTLTSQAGGKLTLSDGVGNSQQVTLTAIGAGGSETINFGSFGVAIKVVSGSGETAANVAAGLATGPATPPVISIGGASGTDLRNGDAIAQTSASPVTEVGMAIWGGAINLSEPPTAVASPGVAQGTLTVSVTPLGHMTGSLGGENFAGDLAAFSPGAHSSMTLTGSRGDTITISYYQDPFGASLSDQAIDFNTGHARFTFVAGSGTAAVSGLTAGPGTTAGTYSFTSSAPGSLTLNGSGGPWTAAVGDMGANGTQTLTFGNISFTLTADANGMSAAAIVSNLLQPANDTIVVTSSGGAPGAAGTVITGAGTGATFQIGANEGDTLGVTFGDARTSALGGLDVAITAFTNAAGGTGSITTTAGALITAADAAIGLVSTARGNFGAVENRLNHTVASISAASENLNASQSRIKDLDVASEMVNFTKTQVLQQAGTAILAQANSAPQSILTLLR